MTIQHLTRSLSLVRLDPNCAEKTASDLPGSASLSPVLSSPGFGSRHQVSARFWRSNHHNVFPWPGRTGSPAVPRTQTRTLIGAKKTPCLGLTRSRRENHGWTVAANQHQDKQRLADQSRNQNGNGNAALDDSANGAPQGTGSMKATLLAS